MINKVIRNIIFFILILSIYGCYNVHQGEKKKIIQNLSTAYKNLSVNQEAEIKLPDFYNDYLKILSLPYVSKEEFIRIVKEEELAKNLSWLTASQENCHLFVIDNNSILVDMILPGYVGMRDRVLFSNEKDIILKVKKIDRELRPLIIEELQ